MIPVWVLPLLCAGFFILGMLTPMRPTSKARPPLCVWQIDLREVGGALVTASTIARDEIWVTFFDQSGKIVVAVKTENVLSITSKGAAE